MARQNEDYTRLSRADITGSALGTSPRAVAAIEDLQRAAYENNPADTAAAQTSADAAQASADGAQASASAAQTSADSAGTRADTAQARADAAYTMADGKVTKKTLTSPVNYSGTASAMYMQAELQAAMDKITSLTTTVQQLVAALKV